MPKRGSDGGRSTEGYEVRQELDDLTTDEGDSSFSLRDPTSSKEDRKLAAGRETSKVTPDPHYHDIKSASAAPTT